MMPVVPARVSYTWVVVCHQVIHFPPCFIHLWNTLPMTSTNPRAGWEKIGNQFYQKVQLYESIFDPDLELGNYLVAGAPYGGALGMLTLSG